MRHGDTSLDLTGVYIGIGCILDFVKNFTSNRTLMVRRQVTKQVIRPGSDFKGEDGHSLGR